MPEPQEQTPDQARFERIEAAHEFLTGIVAGTAVTQQKLEEAQLRTELAFTKVEEAQLRTQTALNEAVEHMARGHRELHTAQVIMYDEMGKLARAQAKSETAQAETQGKLDVLIDMWNNWIVENGKNGGKGNPAPRPPPAA